MHITRSKPARLTALLLLTPLAAAVPQDPPRVIAWNDLGMHCMDPDFGVFAVLPPFNTLNAQLLLNGKLVDPAGSGITLYYRGIADPQGSINTTSIGKTNFWDYDVALFGVDLPLDVGLTGSAMPGANNTPQPMTYDPTWKWSEGQGIPMMPIDDAHNKNTYPLMEILALDSNGNQITSTVTTAPNSLELTCSMCHGTNGNPFARPDGGWIGDPDPVRDDRLNILALHDDRQLGDPTYDAALAAAGYNPAGLLATVQVDNTPILCARCHGSNALPGTGIAGISPLTSAVHSLHGTVVDPTSTKLDDIVNRTACYSCHPGFDTKCLRGAMGSAIGDDGDFEMQCQSCHSNLSAVGDPTRVGWLEEPACQNCHTGTATQNSGQIRFTSAFDDNGNLRQPASQIFATTPDVPAAGFSLYRFSSGHADLQCSVCHGPPHAIYPTAVANDNVQSQQLQGHVGTISDCMVCHAQLQDSQVNGPHGMHPVSQKWVKDLHGDIAEHDSSSCKDCHGKNYKGTVLSHVQGDRSFSTKFGQKNFFRGQRISCYTCHDGPNDDDHSTNTPPVVSNKSLSTPADTPVTVDLSGSDANGDSLSYRIIDQPLLGQGTVAISGHTATYLPDGEYQGPASFTFAAWDGKSDSNLGTVTVNVQPPACPGTTDVYGFGCPGTGGELPTLSVSGCPTPGGRVTLTMANALPGAGGFFGVGAERGSKELWPGCVLLIDAIDRRTGTLPIDGNGELSLSFTIPASLVGQRMTFQGFVYDGGASHGLAASNGAEIVIH